MSERRPHATGAAPGSQHHTTKPCDSGPAPAPQAAPGVDLAAALEFLDHWCGEDVPHVTLVAIVPDGSIDAAVFAWPDRADELLDWVERVNLAGRNVYFSVNLADPQVRKKPKKGDLIALVAVHADLDPRNGVPLEDERVRLLKLADELAGRTRPPSFIIDSGGGIQVFYRLAARVAATPEAIVDLEALNRRLEAALGGKGTHNADRIMRLPGTVNWPNAKKRKAGRGPSMAHMLRAGRGR
jgi:hypothetical protein